MILWYFSVIGAHLGPNLVQFCIEKWSVFGHWWYYHIFIISIDCLKDEMKIHAIKSSWPHLACPVKGPSNDHIAVHQSELVMHKSTLLSWHYPHLSFAQPWHLIKHLDIKTFPCTKTVIDYSALRPLIKHKTLLIGRKLYNISLAANGALVHRLQRHTTWKSKMAAGVQYSTQYSTQYATQYATKYWTQ